MTSRDVVSKWDVASKDFEMKQLSVRPSARGSWMSTTSSNFVRMGPRSASAGLS